MTGQKFYICKHCGNIIAFVNDSGIPIVCCGELMSELEPNTVDASREKHVPIITADGNIVTVEVGSAAHPMTDEHHIAWISLETDKGNQRKELDHTAEPKTEFHIGGGEKVIAAYAYCNLHGLWKKEI